MNSKQIWKEIRKFNPIIRIRKADAESWLKRCEKELFYAFEQHQQAKTRYEKANKKYKELYE